MYKVKIKTDFSAAHNLVNYRGKCERLHGHNWLIEAVFAYRAFDKDGMAVDFKIARKIVNGVVEALDHSYLNEIDFFKKTNPTSENIAKYIYDNVKKKEKNIRSVTVWENDNACATYQEG